MSGPKCLLHVRLWPTGMLQLVVAFGAIVAALGLNARTVNALDVDTNTTESVWCIETGDSSALRNCTYHDFLTCAVASIGAGASCKAGSSVPADALDASSHRAADSSRRSTQSTIPHRTRGSSLSVVEREKLFHEFVEWNRRRSNQTDIASGIH